MVCLNGLSRGSNSDTEVPSSCRQPMPAPKNPSPQIAIALTFTAPELSQLEAFATLHGTTVAAFVQKAALKAAHIAPNKKSPEGRANALGALWLTDDFSDATEAKEEAKTPDPFAPGDARPEKVAVAPAPTAKRGVVGEQSALAKGHGLVWEIRRALGRERVHGLGWTREQLAFVLKLSVVGVRKMEHLGITPVKSLESRRALLGLAKTLENPTPEIVAYIEREEEALRV